MTKKHQTRGNFFLLSLFVQQSSLIFLIFSPGDPSDSPQVGNQRATSEPLFQSQTSHQRYRFDVCQITHVRVDMHQHHRNACELYLSLRANKGVYPSCAPPLLCQLNNRIFETCLLNVWDCFLSNSTSTAAGHTVCRSAKQFVSALSLHAWGELTGKSNTLFAESDSSHPDNLGGGNRVCLLLKHLPVGLQRPL